jgi:hypothetical protein
LQLASTLFLYIWIADAIIYKAHHTGREKYVMLARL